MNKFTDKEYAEYMLANYYLGYSDIAYFMAAVLFEGHIMRSVKPYENDYLDEWNKTNGKKKDRLELSEAISKLYIEKNIWKKGLYGDYSKKNVKTLLLDYKDLRNLIAHGGIQDLHHKKEIKLKKTKNRNAIIINLDDFILDVYSLVTGEVCSAKLLDKKTYKTLQHDYKLKEINERMISKIDDLSLNINSKKFKSFSGFISQDYENLFLLRDKLVILQKYLSYKMIEIGLEPTILSPIDTTSAYIWMPFVDKGFIKSSNDIIETKRHNLVMGSTSILATPLDFRIYIDFGGGDINFRSTYQKFIQTKSFKEYVKNHFATIEPSLKIFETRWYSAIVDEKNFLDFIDQNSYALQIENAQIFLKNAKAQHNIITSGRNLIGFIFPSSEEISKEFILERFRDIAHLYYEYLIYKYPNHEKILREKQKKLLNDNKDDENHDLSMDDVDDYLDSDDQDDDFNDNEDPMNPIIFK